MTTDARTAGSGRKRRASKRALRVAAWSAGLAGFLSPWGVLAAAPRPVTAAPPAPPLKPKVIIKHRVIRHIVWTDAPVTSSAPSVHYVYVSSGGGGGGSAPVAHTGGSHP